MTMGDASPHASAGDQRSTRPGADHARPASPSVASSPHLPPQNLDAEEAILGAMMMSTAAIEAAADLKLREKDFYRPSHRILYRTILELADRDSVDELTVVNALRHSNELAEVGGSAAIMSLVERVPAVANARAYAQEVVAQSVLRGLVETGHEIARLGYEHPEDPERLVDMAGMLVGDLSAQRSSGDFIDASSLLGPIYDELAERAETGATAKGLLTGFHDFDQRTGGLQPGNLVIVAGRPGMGKTSWAMNIAENVVIDTDEGGVAIFSLEMEPKDLMTRMLSSVAKVDSKRLRSEVPNEQDWPHLIDAVGKLMKPDRLFIADTRELTPMTLRASCRRLHQQLRDKGGLKLVVIDYIGLMEGGRRFEGRTQEISYITRQLKSLALELEVPIIALSQLNRAVESRPDKRPLMSDLRESGSIEQDADMIIFLYRPEYYMKDETPPEWQGKAELMLAKFRAGQPGSSIVGFLGKYTKFVNLTMDATREARDNRPGRASGGAVAASVAAALGGASSTEAPPAGDPGLPPPPLDAYEDIT